MFEGLRFYSSANFPIRTKLSKSEAIPVTGLDRPSGFHVVEVLRFCNNWHMKVASLSALCTSHLSPPGNIPDTHFCYRLSQPQDHSATRRIMSMKNSNGTIGNWTCDLLTCSASPHARTKLEPTYILGWHSTVRTACMLSTELPKTHIFLFATMSKNWHWVTPVQWTSQAISARVKQLGVKFAIHLNLPPMLKLCGPVTSNTPLLYDTV